MLQELAGIVPASGWGDSAGDWTGYPQGKGIVER